MQISTGVTLRENNLKEVEGGKILESEGVLVANKRALKKDPRLMKVVHELIERFEVGHLVRIDYVEGCPYICIVDEMSADSQYARIHEIYKIMASC